MSNRRRDPLKTALAGIDLPVEVAVADFHLPPEIAMKPQAHFSRSAEIARSAHAVAAVTYG